jgi:putative flippase GtrA
VPVDWVDDPDSRVDVVGTAVADLHGIWRMVTTRARREPHVDGRTRTGTSADVTSQLVRFASIGVVSTVVFAVLFALLAGPLGFVAADVVALGICSIANTAANRRLTFSLHGRTGRARHYRAALVLALLPLALTLLTLLVLAVVGVTSLPATLLCLTAASAVAALARFVLLRQWVFR